MSAQGPGPSGRPGPRNALTDVAGLRVGSAHDDALRTGVTVILPDAPAVAAVDVRGGGPGTRETEALAPSSSVRRAHAVVLSGGSALGLGAGDAVAAALSAGGAGLQVQPDHPPVPIVPAAILYDLTPQARAAYAEQGPPHPRLARAALAAARAEGGGEVAEGSAGAGRGAHAGRLKGGQGTSSSLLDGLSAEGPVTAAALVCANPVGSVVMPGAAAFWAWPLERRLDDGWEFGGVRPPADLAPTLDPLPAEGPLALARAAARGASTRIAGVAPDRSRTSGEARRVAMMAHDGFARAARPAHTPFDG
ncbi:MAG: P1 family peptidase, partial [Pseudomonadota bacterium]